MKRKLDPSDSSLQKNSRPRIEVLVNNIFEESSNDEDFDPENASSGAEEVDDEDMSSDSDSSDESSSESESSSDEDSSSSDEDSDEGSARDLFLQLITSRGQRPLGNSSNDVNENEHVQQEGEEGDGEIFERGQNVTNYAAKDGVTVLRVGKKPTIDPSAVAGRSCLLDRLKQFLPEMEAASERLEKEKEEGPVSMEVDESDEEDQYIEMNLGLGVLEEKGVKTGANDDLEDGAPLSPTASSSSNPDANDIMLTLRGKGKEQPTKKVIHEIDNQ